MALDPAYGITISPPPSLQSLGYRIEEFYERIDSVLRRMCKYYILYPEFDKTARLHFHGVCTGVDMIKYYATKYKLDRIGFTKIDKLKTSKDNLRWILYCQKEWRRTSRVFSESKIMLEPLLKKNKRKRAVEEMSSIRTLDYYFGIESAKRASPSRLRKAK